MENPTSVQTETHSSLALQFGQSAAILTEAFQENLTSTLPPFLRLHLLCPFNTSLLPQKFTFETVFVEVQ